jgi:hypothetical protein
LRGFGFTATSLNVVGGVLISTRSTASNFALSALNPSDITNLSTRARAAFSQFQPKPFAEYTACINPKRGIMAMNDVSSNDALGIFNNWRDSKTLLDIHLTATSLLDLSALAIVASTSSHGLELELALRTEPDSLRINMPADAKFNTLDLAVLDESLGMQVEVLIGDMRILLSEVRST